MGIFQFSRSCTAIDSRETNHKNHAREWWIIGLSILWESCTLKRHSTDIWISYSLLDGGRHFGNKRDEIKGTNKEQLREKELQRGTTFPFLSTVLLDKPLWSLCVLDVVVIDSHWISAPTVLYRGYKRMLWFTLCTRFIYGPMTKDRGTTTVPYLFFKFSKWKVG